MAPDHLSPSFRATKEGKLAEKDLNFAFEISLHRDGMEDHFGHLPGGCYREDDNSDEEDGMDDDDRMYDQAMPAAWEEIESSFKKIVKMTMPGHSYKNKKHAVVSVVAIAMAAWSSPSELARELREDETLNILVFNKGLVPLLEKCTKSDLVQLKSEPILAKVKALLSSQDQKQYWAPLEAKFFAGV